MDWLNKPKFIKNMTKEEIDYPVQQELLNTWVIPKVDIKTIYKLGTFEKFAGKTTVKTTELSFTMDKDSAVFRLLCQNDIDYYRSKDFNYLHIGLIQVAFKPLTLKGLPESFEAAVPQEITEEEISEVTQDNNGRVTLRFKTHEIPRLTDTASRLTRSVSSYISPVDYTVDIPSRASTSQINYENIVLDKNNIAKGNNDRFSDPTDSEMNFPTGLHD